MKKKIFGAALIAAMAITAGWNFNQSKNEVELSDLALANVEALANDESGTGSGYCTMHTPCFNEQGNPTGKHSASSYPGPGCNGSYHSHGCTNCNKA